MSNNDDTSSLADSAYLWAASHGALDLPRDMLELIISAYTAGAQSSADGRAFAAALGEPQALAAHAAEAIRALNHATQDHDSLHFPSDVYEILLILRPLAVRLGETFAHLASWVMAEANAGRIEDESGESPGTLIDDLLAALAKAQESVDWLANHLRRAHNDASGLKAAPG